MENSQKESPLETKAQENARDFLHVPHAFNSNIEDSKTENVTDKRNLMNSRMMLRGVSSIVAQRRPDELVRVVVAKTIVPKPSAKAFQACFVSTE